MTVTLVGDTLSILGRNNYGFQVRGNWTSSDTGGGETFTGAGLMTLISAVGDIPFPSPPISISTKPDDIAGFGVVDQDSISFAGMDFKTNAFGALNDVLDNVGLNLSLSGMQFGVALGKTLSDNILASVDAPLVDGIPYLYFSTFNAPQVSFGGIGIGVDNTAGMAVIFDPADPFLYVNGMDPRGDVLAVGVSAKGQIPYTPSRELDERIDNPDDDGDNLYGNLYLRGKIVIPVKAVDVGIDGAITIDANLNGDGNNFYDQIDSNFLTQLVNGDAEAGRKLKDAITDLGIGVNGKLSLGFAKAGINIELPVGSAAMFKGDRIAFSGGTV